MADEAVQKKTELLRLLSEAEPQACRLEAFGREVVRAARLSRDVIAPIRDLFLHAPANSLSPEQWDLHVDNWRSWQQTADKLETSLTAASSFVAVTNNVASTCSGTFTVVSLQSSLPAPILITLGNAQARLNQTLERLPLLQDAEASMRRLGLEARGGSLRSPLHLLAEARGALEQPAVHEGGPVSVLIALRQCILSTISELLRRRPIQEATSKTREKLTSLGRQAGRSDLDETHFERLAVEVDKLVNELSRAKQSGIPRQELTASFNSGVLLLNALMQSIDEARLRL
jgi:hypothetical protein